MKFSFISNGNGTAGTFQGKLCPVFDLAKAVISASAQSAVAIFMIAKGGIVGIVAVACIEAIKICIESEDV